MSDESTPHIPVPLPDYIREAATISAWTVIKEHTVACPIGKLDERVKVLETRFNILVGAIIGSGALGGTVGAVIMKLLGG